MVRARSSHPVLLAGLCLLLAAAPSVTRAIILYDTGDPDANTTAPSGIYADSGWAFTGAFGSSLGTMIAPQYFITAQHIGLQGSTFVSTSALNGGVDVTYTIDTAANGGIGYWDIGGSDLRIFKINETFASYAALYSGSSPAGLDAMTVGRGGVRGAEVVVSSELKGWQHTASDGVFRWGSNVIDGTALSEVGTMLVAGFDAAGSPYEATLSAGDSGGGLFVLENGEWKLAGVNYGVDGLFDYNGTVDSGEFGAALFDKGGLFQGNDAEGWLFVGDQAEDIPSNLYASSIAANLDAIQTIAGVPEPTGALLAVLGLTFFGPRGRRRS
jgi:hypothetical protein